MVDDARTRTKSFLDTYLTAANMLKPDAVTPLSFHVQFAAPEIPLIWLFEGKSNDVLFILETAESEPVVDWEGSVSGYKEKVPILIYTKDNPTVDGRKARWQCEAELRRVVETYPLTVTSAVISAYRNLQRMGDAEQNMGAWTLYSVKYVLSYQRGTT